MEQPTTPPPMITMLAVRGRLTAAGCYQIAIAGPMRHAALRSALLAGALALTPLPALAADLTPVPSANPKAPGARNLVGWSSRSIRRAVSRARARLAPGARGVDRGPGLTPRILPACSTPSPSRY